MEVGYKEALGVPVVFPRQTATALNRLETQNWDLIAALAHLDDNRAVENLRDQLRKMSGRTHIFFAPSARCAIARILTALPETEVVVPAWTCSAVKRAVEVAGKRIVCVDIDKRSLNATSAQFLRAIRPGRVLIPTHLFGIPTDIVRICDVAREYGCPTIEDAAGAYPAQLEDRLLGTFGDVGIISFERSKRVPAFRGAAIIVNNEAAVDISKLQEQNDGAVTTPVRELLFGFAHNLGSIPWLYGRFTVPQMLKKYGTESDAQGRTTLPTKDDPFFTRELHSYQAALVSRVLGRICSIREHIARLVEAYEQAFRGTQIRTFVVPGCDKAGLLRFPIVIEGRKRSEILRAALQRGLFLETNYERTLANDHETEMYPNSAWAARNVLLLPLYARLPVEAAIKIASEMVGIERATRTTTEVLQPIRA